jgi:two-component sensor histidine kinase
MMIRCSQTAATRVDPTLLYISELLHRIANEYTGAISFASRVVARSSNDEAKAALSEVIDYLHALADAHRILSPPLTHHPTDLTERVTKLCRTMASAGLEKRGISFHLSLSEPVFLDAERCWRVSLIIAELITNALRHAFITHGGRVSVSIEIETERIICRVSDDGPSCTTFNPGLGSQLVNAIANEIEGRVERRFSGSGTTITLSFPKESSAIIDLRHSWCSAANWSDAPPAAKWSS